MYYQVQGHQVLGTGLAHYIGRGTKPELAPGIQLPKYDSYGVCASQSPTLQGRVPAKLEGYGPQPTWNVLPARQQRPGRVRAKLEGDAPQPT